jgi:deoxyhypusine synthase
MDIVQDITWFNNTTIGLKKSGLIILGSGVVKHSILNANMLRNGADYAVYINNSQEFDGSDAGARPDEAVSWGKIQKNGESVKVFGDATILFPLIVASTFASD